MEEIATIDAATLFFSDVASIFPSQFSFSMAESDLILVLLSLVDMTLVGGKIEISEVNGFKLRLTGGMPAILVVHDDRAGCIANVANCLAMHQVNIGHMEVSRIERGLTALMVIEGLEGAGKTTARNVVVETLEQLGIRDMVFTREPGG